MKELQVRIIDNNTLELLENGMKGDHINLLELQEIDLTPIQKAIEAKRDEVYNLKLQEALELAKSNHQVELEKQASKNNIKVAELKAEIVRINESTEDKLANKENETKEKYTLQINELEKELINLKNTLSAQLEGQKMNHQVELNNLTNELKAKEKELTKVKEEFSSHEKLELETLEAKLEAKYKGDIADLKAKLNNKDAEVKNKLDSALMAKEKEIRDELNKELEQKVKMIESKTQELDKTKDELNLLRNQKSNTNIKNIGEELETYCDNEVTEMMQNGWFNCSWIKDNKVVKNEGDTSGSKADYIFKVFADENKNEATELASVCLDMKDENPNSKHKQKNSDYFKALDENRKKKHCKYAVLVSNLEMEHGAVLPIIRAKEYEDMYVVRPGYLVTFLNMIISLTNRFKEVILSKEKEELEIKDKKALLEEFNKIKNTYLDKPLEQMDAHLTNINKSSAAIYNANCSIQEDVEKIRTSYINAIKDKLEKFELKFNSEYKKYLKNHQ